MGLEKLSSKIYPGFGFSMLDRAFKEHDARRCSNDELREIRNYFEQSNGLTCVYCGSNNPKRWDHLYPVSKGGDTVKGNLVPSCQPCDDSKQNKTLEEWFKSSAKKKPDIRRQPSIVRAMNRYMEKYKYSQIPFDEKLDAAQAKIYNSFISQIELMRKYLRSNNIIK